MSVSEHTTQKLVLASWVWMFPIKAFSKHITPAKSLTTKKVFDPLAPARQWLNTLAVDNPKKAHFLCQLIPAQCPFERDVQLFGRTLFHIPAMCKLNPLYEEVVGLRFRALCYLADECGEDITAYC
ncbi:MAG: nitrogenase [Symploca sp. SIO3C6]|uniref:Nitrogenase n=1 Tax=Symploca sp. SIO1C4 TaxID=2607765 RepID=A0A6B3NHS0_9CYAN|nr:nitrogenase [Symploca sp. SIO3C6]NER29191.1 nitrogenase [Symploca sp. SIO1C4]